jgi:hypothetical protein
VSVDYDFLDDLDSSAFLDSTIGHLRYVNHDYTALNYFAYSDLKGWYKPTNGWHATEADVVVTIQNFNTGGFEATGKYIDMLKLGDMMSSKPKTGKRESHDKVKENDQIRSVQRAKKKARQLIKNKGCDRMLTLTKRESDPSKFWTKDDWLKAFREFIRRCRDAGIVFPYVGTPEKHIKGNYHMHIAIKGHVHINTIRQIWWGVTGGRGMGNVDISFYQHKTPSERLAGVAKYVSKYITKQLSSADFNRKRYWASRDDDGALPPAKRLILNAKNMADALVELADALCLDFDALKEKVFEFGSGFWFSYEPEMAKEVPF